MNPDDILPSIEVPIELDYGVRKNGHLGLSPTSFPELRIAIKNAFSVDKTKREIACDLCKIVLASLNNGRAIFKWIFALFWAASRGMTY